MITLIKTVVGSYPVILGKAETITDKIKSIFGIYDPYLYSIKRAVNDQLNIGIDVVSDGQVRGDMVEIFVNNLYGVEDKRVINKIEYISPITLNDVKFAKKIVDDYNKRNNTNKSIKGIITGPCTLSASVRIENYYSDNKDKNLIIDFAKVLRKEVENLLPYISVLQIDEPILSTGMYDLNIAKECIEIITKDINIPISLHVCGNVLNIFNDLNTFPVDILDHEFASNRKNLEILEESCKKIGFGCVNTKSKKIDSIDEIKDLLFEGYEVLKNNKTIQKDKKFSMDNYLIVDPDCGMRLLPLEVCRSKLKNMVIASEMFENEIKNK